MSSTTFLEVTNNVCNGSESCFVANADVLSWADEESSGTNIPVDLILAEWCAEGTHTINSVGAECNDPGNANHGNYLGCGTTYTTPASCSYYTPNYYSSLASDGINVQINLINAKYCAISQAFLQASLTSGGQQLYNLAQSRGYHMLQNGTYNAAYAWGASGWAGSGYKDPSGIFGSYLIELIQDDSLAQYDYVASY